MKERAVIRRGSVVRLKGRKKTAKVVELLADVKGGVVLDRPLGGFRCWNKLDLARASDSASAGQK